jgi:hypothetical protein
MIDSIRSGVVPNIPKASAATPAQAPSQLPAQEKAVPQKADTVNISDAAQARSLRQQGMNIPEIALQLRLDVKTVNGFFPKSS